MTPKSAFLLTVPLMAVAVMISRKEERLVNGLASQSCSVVTMLSFVLESIKAWDPTLNALVLKVRLTLFKASVSMVPPVRPKSVAVSSKAYVVLLE